MKPKIVAVFPEQFNFTSLHCHSRPGDAPAGKHAFCLQLLAMATNGVPGEP
jgi:hypothetical protein